MQSRSIRGRIVRILDSQGRSLSETMVTSTVEVAYKQNREATTVMGGQRAHIGDWVEIIEGNLNVLQMRHKEWAEAYVLNAKRSELERWSHFLSQVRGFFVANHFIELFTPTVVTCPGTEPCIDIYFTEKMRGSQMLPRALITSPELHLKKSLALGFGDVFEIAKVFRNGETTDRHRSEFFMLEWYRSFAGRELVSNDVVALTRFLCQAFQISEPSQFSMTSISDLFLKHLNFKLKANVTRNELAELCISQNIRVREQDSLGDLFYLLMNERIEPALDPNEMLFAYGYPISEAALARQDRDGFGARFEVYWKGLELANAFEELTDPAIQRTRSQTDLEERRRLGKKDIQLDEGFFAALEFGMPPSCGIALGLERLYMAMFDVKNIQELYLFRD